MTNSGVQTLVCFDVAMDNSIFFYFARRRMLMKRAWRYAEVNSLNC